MGKQWQTLFLGAPKSLLKNWCFWAVVLEKTLESTLDCKEIQPVHPKGNQYWIFIGRTDVEVETPILWPPHAKNWLTGKDPDAGIDWKQEEKGTTEDEMVGWRHRLNGHEFEQASRVGDGQGRLVCCNPWGRKESDMTEWLNWIENHCRWWLHPWNSKAPWKKSYDKPRQHTKKQRHYFASKGSSSQSNGFSSSHVRMWELDHKEGWAPKDQCFWTVVLEKTLKSTLDCKETQLVHSKGNQSWIFIGRTDAAAETSIFWPPDAKNWLTEKTLMLGKMEGGRRRDDRGWVGWMHLQLDGHEFEQASRVGDGQGILVCCSPWACKESDMTECPKSRTGLNWNGWI